MQTKMVLKLLLVMIHSTKVGVGAYSLCVHRHAHRIVHRNNPVCVVQWPGYPRARPLLLCLEIALLFLPHICGYMRDYGCPKGMSPMPSTGSKRTGWWDAFSLCMHGLVLLGALVAEVSLIYESSL